jgi:5'-3' exonuclease
VNVHLIDGTYELFRHFYSPARLAEPTAPGDLSAVRGVVASVLGMLQAGATHIGVATDHVIESFRNELWPGYKTSEGVDPALLAQFEPLEDALDALGIVVWPMVEFEADDALAAGADVCARDHRVERVYICTPDKDLAQCVADGRVVQLDRRTGEVRDDAGVQAKFGVPPASIPDYLALVGDSSDGYPGLPGWGAKSASAVLARYGHIEDIPRSVRDWDVRPRGAPNLAATLAADFDLALLFKRLATLRTDAPVCRSVDELRWTGPRHRFDQISRRTGAPGLAAQARALAAGRGPTAD